MAVPQLGFGTCKIFEEMKSAVNAALTAGYHLFDTARAYNNEEHLGRALQDCLPAHSLTRRDIFIQTKILIAAENVADTVFSDVEDSLKMLQTDYIDIVLIHYPKNNDAPNDSEKNAEMRKEAYLALEQMKEKGLIHHVGVSNYEIAHLEEVKSYGKSLPFLNQIELHPHFVRKELVDYCKIMGIAVQNLAEKHNCSVTNVLLSWASSQEFLVIPKSSNPIRIAENMKALSIILSPDEIASLSELDRGKNYVARCTGWLVR